MSNVQTIEKTGKGLKLQKALSVLLIFAGIGLAFVNLGWLFLTGAGLLWLIVVEILVWWRHA